METPTKTAEKQCRYAEEWPPTVRKRSNRPLMTKKSPYYKPPARAGKSTAKKYSTAKKLTSFRKATGTVPTKEEKLKARARAREWAKNRKKSSPVSTRAPVDPSRVVIIDDDEEEDAKAHDGIDLKEKVAKSETCKPPCTKCGTLYQRMLALDIEKKEMKKAAASNLADPSKEEIFYDALEFLPAEPDADIPVEDVSDEEDEEIRELRSSRRNGLPSSGQSWMEPLEPDGVSYSTFAPKQNPQMMTCAMKKASP